MTSNNDHKEIDQHSGVETTGHEWDGIKELNNPAPRWWLIVFFITCIWGFGYWVIYPAWPTLSGEGERGGTKGSMEWTQYSQLKEQQADIVARKAAYLEKFQSSSFGDIMKNPELYAFAIAGGKSAFKDNCATCHGTGGAGGKGYPNLNDDDWLWGGDVTTIYQTIRYGIRSEHEETRVSQMPAFAEMLGNNDIDMIAQYVASLSGGSASSAKGAALYQEHCSSCHGKDAKGNKEFGAPNLADSIWFYSEGDKASIISQIKAPKHGMMPHWNGRLSEDTIRQLSIYVHSLGGGE
jgi:cytochrome c oxidase cbb3-type subunit 3